MKYNIKECGERIRKFRIQSGYTQERLASELNIDRSLLSHIEAGKRGCSVDLLVWLPERRTYAVQNKQSARYHGAVSPALA